MRDVIGATGKIYTVLPDEVCARFKGIAKHPPERASYLRDPNARILGAEALGVDLDEHIAFVIGAMQRSAAVLGLAGTTTVDLTANSTLHPG